MKMRNDEGILEYIFRYFQLTYIMLTHTHKWRKVGSGWDYSEPHKYGGWCGGDYLPTKWVEHRCKKCTYRRRTYTDGFTHLGEKAPRVFVYEEGDYFTIDDLI